MQNEKIPLLDCPKDFILGDASGKLMNEYGRFPCKIKCGVYAYMVQGNARATINITQVEIHAHDGIYIEPGSFLLIHEFSEDAKVCYLVLSSKFLEKNTYGARRVMLPINRGLPILHLNTDQASLAEHFFALLTEAVNCEPGMLDVESMVHIYNLMQHVYGGVIAMSENTSMQPMDRKSEIYNDYCAMVMKHYHEWHHVNEYAEALRITVPHLCSTIRAAGNRTAGDIIVDAILMDAKAQLKITSTPIKEIGLTLGFENVAFFNRFFKLHVGLTPKAYRNS